MYGHTVTIINIVNIRGRNHYYTHVLEGVHYQDKQGVKTGETVQFTDNEGYVRVPFDIGGYVEPQAFRELVDKDGKWTIQEDDLIVKGTYIDEDNPSDTLGARLIKSFENIDYGILIEPEFGIYLK